MLTLPGYNGPVDRLAGRWAALMARALGPGEITGPLREAVCLFGSPRDQGGLGLAGYLAVPGNALNWCAGVSGLFADICCRPGVDAVVIDGFLPVPAAEGRQTVPYGHSAVLVPAGPGRGHDLVIDWTARQFDGCSPVPFLARPGAWRSFWLEDPPAAPSGAAAPTPMSVVSALMNRDVPASW